ncbi:SemiSWEET transporter [Mesorhizobium sp. SP-1A]|uniref:SemiSWEET family sugar transporter n=1 Tax=Mesorhizobium sp. SP-1A TaxID=3077840 RepID=UPI0028F74458|nr:SemiSWEET transporter [Mesorhizobium sp. SP-1A]
MDQHAARFTEIGKSGIERPRRINGVSRKSAALHPAIEIIGAAAALITTLGWIPQVTKVARERRADDISLSATSAIAAGVLLWTLYGLLIGSWPVIIANAATFLFVIAIVGMKLRFG